MDRGRRPNFDQSPFSDFDDFSDAPFESDFDDLQQQFDDGFDDDNNTMFIDDADFDAIDRYEIPAYPANFSRNGRSESSERADDMRGHLYDDRQKRSTAPHSRPRSDNSRGQKKPKKNSAVPLLVALVLIFLVFIGALVVLKTYAFIGSPPFKVVVAKVTDTELDLRESQLTEFNGIDKLSDLKLLDMRGLPVSIDTYNDIRAEVPSDCDVKWSIPIGSNTFDSDTNVISFSDAQVDLSALTYFDKLDKVSAKGCTQYEQLKELSLSMPDCEFIWQIPFCGQTYPATTEELKLEKDTEATEAEKLKLFPNLAHVDASGFNDYETLFKLVEEMPYCSFYWTAKLADQKLSSTDTYVKLGKDSVTDVDKLIKQLSRLPLLKTVDMCDCGLSNKAMDKLIEAFPEKKFIWIVKFGSDKYRYWTLRTDATIFSTLNPSGGTTLDQKDFAPIFKYCTDLVALDLGHNSISDIKAITNLKKLKVLILADNQISDISPLAELHDLEFLEIWTNRISDVSPLASLDNLKDVDLANNYVSDLTPLYTMKDLRSIRLDNSLATESNKLNPLSYDQLNELGRALPDCHIEHLTTDGFPFYRNTPRYLGMKMAFTNYAHVISFNGTDDIKYDDSFYN